MGDKAGTMTSPLLPPLYHGTISTFVPDILRNGLMFKPGNQWRIYIPSEDYSPRRDDDPGYVYLSVKEVAETFAIGKAEYFRALPCHKVVNKVLLDVIKDCDAPVIHDAQPVVLRVRTNELVRSGFERDPRLFDALRYHGSIPSQYIEVLKWDN